MTRVSEIPLSQMPALKIICVGPESSTGNVLGISYAPTKEFSSNTQTSVIFVEEVPCPGLTAKLNVSICMKAGIPSAGLMMSHEKKQVIKKPAINNFRMNVEIFNPRFFMLNGMDNGG